MEKEASEIQANYERDKALWDGKFNFLQQQKNQSKKDLQDAQLKFEQTLEQLQKRGAQDKDKLETNQSALINSVEQRYKNQIKELTESHQNLYNDLIQKNKDLERELRQTNDNLQLEQRGKLSEHGSLEKKLTFLHNEKNALHHELQELKAERDKKIYDYQKTLDRERDISKGKYGELEQKYKETENKRGGLVFEFEKERAKWALEKDHFVNKKTEQQEIIQALEKKKDSLLRENEKYKNERRRPFYNAGAGISNSGIYSGGRFVNISGSRHYKENNFPSKFIGGDEKEKNISLANTNDETSSNHSTHSSKKSSKLTTSISSYKSSVSALEDEK